MKDSDFYYDRQTLYDEVWLQPVYKVPGDTGYPMLRLRKRAGRCESQCRAEDTGTRSRPDSN